MLVCKYVGLSFGKKGGMEISSVLLHLPVCNGVILTEENLKQILSPDVVSW